MIGKYGVNNRGSCCDAGASSYDAKDSRSEDIRFQVQPQRGANYFVVTVDIDVVDGAIGKHVCSTAQIVAGRPQPTTPCVSTITRLRIVNAFCIQHDANDWLNG